MKKTIIHFIYSLGRGGAETMLVRVLKELPQYRNIVVTLNENNHFEQELQCDAYICLHRPSLFSIPAAAMELRKVIAEYNADIVHSHLPQCNFVARLAVPKGVPLITTIHTSIATAIDYKKWYIRLLDKLTYRYSPSVIIAVSKGAMSDYFSVLKLKPQKTFVLYTFVDNGQFQSHAEVSRSGTFRIVSVGALRKGKNYAYLINAFKRLREEDIELHIYGTGPEQATLQEAIKESGVRIVLMGQVKNIHEVLPRYHLFTMPSMFEGFSLSVLEAMAARLPLILSNIVSFREQCEDCAVYFDLENPDDFTSKLLAIRRDAQNLELLAQKAHNRMLENFTLTHHVEQLQRIYKEVTAENNSLFSRLKGN